jgi:hypothetical protein
MVGPAASLHRHHAGRQLLAEPDNPVARHAPAQDHATRLVETRDAAAVLAQINP